MNKTSPRKGSGNVFKFSMWEYRCDTASIIIIEVKYYFFFFCDFGFFYSLRGWVVQSLSQEWAIWYEV